MRAFSSVRHVVHICNSHDDHVLIEDPLLPAAAHLTGAGAADVLRPVIAASGGNLIACRANQVQYRPQSDLVVRYRCQIRRAHHDTTDTVLAATTVSGPPPGTVPIEARHPDGTHLSVGVWRWPFDPILVDLAEMVTQQSAAERLRPAGYALGRRPEVDVVAYRPTERAVIRFRGNGHELFVKIVPPPMTAALVDRHVTLADAGLPVPRVLASGSGWIAMESIAGTTLRDRLKHQIDPLLTPLRCAELLEALADTDLPNASPTRSRLDDARHHAAMLATVAPDERGHLAEITERLAAPIIRERPAGTVHGDLHEGQLVVDDHSITGLLDIDDLGVGDPLDDAATLIAHLTFRAMTSGEQRTADYASAVRSALSSRDDGPDLDRRIAAVLVGLATGPFRIQQADWISTTRNVLDRIDHHLALADGLARIIAP